MKSKINIKAEKVIAKLENRINLIKVSLKLKILKDFELSFKKLLQFVL